MPTRPAFEGVNAEALEHLRIGTRDQYESEWRFIAADATHSFTHSLGEIPWLVDVLWSGSADGKAATVPVLGLNEDYTYTKSETAIVLTNEDTSAHYFKVRAM